ncbi:MAG TPA: GGDEF domain-containing protein [Candidatus Saccharimonadales bacterium]|nr:GGDEF domain-containing protein [Candidatus Saccharimonadales bacterium]
MSHEFDKYKGPYAVQNRLTAMLIGALEIGVQLQRESERRAAETLIERQRGQRSRQEARTDALTGLPNRRAFIEKLNTTLGSLRRHDDLSALLVGDLDYFKEVNDTFGHPAGDVVLASIGQSMRHSLREAYVARTGGDEFAAIVDLRPSTTFTVQAPGPELTPEQRAQIAAAKLSESASFAVQRLSGDPVFKEKLPDEFRDRQISLRTGISFGVYVLNSTDTADSAIAKADINLYDAKSQRAPAVRNR